MLRLRELVHRTLLCVVLGCAFIPSAFSSEVSASGNGELAAYVNRADESFGWREATSGRIGGVEYVEYLMTSQTWRGIAWKHQFFVLRPANMAREVRQGLLFIHGGRWKPEYEIGRAHV